MSGTEMTDSPSDDDDILAAEFCLGALPGPELARLARRVEIDPAFARRVAEWEERLAPMADRIAEVPPAPAAKRNLDRRLFGEAPQTRGGLWSNLAFWRGLAIATTAAFFVVVAQPNLLRPETAGERLAASLTADGSSVSYLVIYDPETGQVRLAHVSGEPVEGRDFQLWVAQGSEAPVSLGVIPAAQSTQVEVSEQIRALMNSASHMAISLEPPGGSPTGQPTGPVLAVGNLLDI